VQLDCDRYNVTKVSPKKVQSKAIVGVPLDSVRRFRATLLLHTTCGFPAVIGGLVVWWLIDKPNTEQGHSQSQVASRKWIFSLRPKTPQGV